MITITTEKYMYGNNSWMTAWFGPISNEDVLSEDIVAEELWVFLAVWDVWFEGTTIVVSFKLSEEFDKDEFEKLELEGREVDSEISDVVLDDIVSVEVVM